jgi:hypothetical protein
VTATGQRGRRTGCSSVDRLQPHAPCLKAATDGRLHPPHQAALEDAMIHRAMFNALTAFALALFALTGCTTSAANNTTYAQYQGPSPDAEITGMRPKTIDTGGY